MKDDAISRQAAVEGVKTLHEVAWKNWHSPTLSSNVVIDMIKDLPSVQPEAISLEWIDKHLEWLDNCDNDFAQLARVAIRAMVELWKKDRT